MGGGVYDGHRGGYSSSFDTYSTWKNNTPGLYNEYNIDGSWLNNGDYDRAFKGYPSHKTVNIFLGAQYSEPSWKTTLISGGLGLGIQALGMWALGLFVRGKSANQQTASLNFPQTNYIAGFFNTWKLPSLYGNDGILTKQTPDDTTKGTNPPTNTDDNNKKSVTKEVNPPSTDLIQNFDATAKNIKAILEVSGVIKNAGKLNSDGYPASFEIHDTSRTNNKNKPNIYYYEFVKVNNNNNKPVYKIAKAEVYLAEGQTRKNAKGKQNLFIVSNGITKDEGVTSAITDMKAINPQGASIHTAALATDVSDDAQATTITYP